MVDYALAYGGPPEPDMPWPLFLMLAERAGRREARSIINTADGVALGIAASFANDPQVRMEHRKLQRVAYPH